jgi:hypothetical protein
MQITVEQKQTYFTSTSYMMQIYKETTVKYIIYSITLIRMLVIRIANYPDRLGPSGKFV